MCTYTPLKLFYAPEMNTVVAYSLFYNNTLDIDQSNQEEGLILGVDPQDTLQYPGFALINYI